MKKALLCLCLIAGGTVVSQAQNFISGVVSVYGDNAASGSTTIANGASLFLYKNKWYEGGNFINLGDSTSISADSGMLVLNGSAAQTVTGRFKLSSLNLSNATGAAITTGTVPTMVTILDSVFFGNVNNAVFDAGDSLMTLRSNALNTARIADLSNKNVNSGNAIAGKVEVERYIRSRRAWHLLAPPTTADSANGQTMQTAWQEGVRAPRGQIVNPNPGYGTVITRPGGNTTATGYDDGIMQSPYYSIHTYFSNGLYTQPPNTDLTHFSPNAAYMLFIRGDRSVSPEFQTNIYRTPSTITTLRSKGALFNGNVVKTVTNASGAFAGIANPYACAVDFSKATLSNVQNGFWTWDPSINTVGGWVYIDGDDNYNATPVTSGGVGVYTDPATNAIIQSGQAILVKPTAASGSITFHEQDKNIYSRVNVFRESPLPAITVNLFSGGNNPFFMDGATVLFDNSFSKNVVVGEDIGKPVNTNENLSFYADSLTLMKEKFPLPSVGDTLPLRLWQTSARPYSFSISMKYLTGASQIYLLDKYLKTTSPLRPDAETPYNFNITSDAASKAADRFAIVFGASVLPVTFSQIKANWNGEGVQVLWSIRNETNVEHFEVEHSTDGINLTKIGTVTPTAGTTVNYSYSFLDKEAKEGDHYYRVRSVKAAGSFTYTGIAKATVPGGVMTVLVTPNPVKDHVIRLMFKNAPVATYQLVLFSSDGKKVLENTIAHPGATSVHSIPAASLAQGVYHVVITNEKDEKSKKELQIIIQ